MSNSKKPRDYKPPVQITVTGATAPDGTPYVRIAASGKSEWVRLAEFTAGGSEALRILKERGLPLLKDQWKQCKEKVAELKSFPAKPLIGRIGWNEPHFALPDGTVFPASGKRPVVLFPSNEHKCAAAGSIKRWRNLTALLKDQPLAAFFVFAAYAGPFVSLCNHAINVGFELAGPPGVGKSTLLRLAAAVCGPADNPLGENYWITANATINGLEQVMKTHGDLPLIIDECNLYAAADNVAARAAKMNELVFRLSDGTEKRRFGSGRPVRSRFVFITSTNEPLAQLLEAHRVAVAEAAADRLLTIPVAAERPFGIFDCLPDGWESGGALAEHINRETRRCFGVGMRRMLSRLVAERAADPKAFARRLRRYMSDFRQAVGVDGHDGSETRVADHFGLVYAAAMFAIRYGAVSKRLDPLKAAKHCYLLNRASRIAPGDRVRQLRMLGDELDTIRIARGAPLREMSDEELNEAPAIVRERPGGQHELLLTQRQLERQFANLRAFFADPAVHRVLVAENGRRQTKRQIRSNVPAERIYCFRVGQID